MRLAAPAPRRHSLILISLVDVLFVLLLFFLLASRALEPAVLPVQLDAAAPPALTVLSLHPGGGLRLEGRAMELQAVLAQLPPHEAVSFQVPAGTPFGELLPAVQALHSAGITPVLAVTP